MRAIRIPFTWIRNDTDYWFVPFSDTSNLNAHIARIKEVKGKHFEYWVRGKRNISGKVATLWIAKNNVMVWLFRGHTY